MRNTKWHVITALVIIALFSFTPVRDLSADGPDKAGAKVPKLQSVLSELNDNYDRGLLQETQQLIDSRGIIVKDDKVRVMLDLMPGATLDESVLLQYGIEIERKHDTFWRVLAPIGALRRMAGELEDVRFIRNPMKPYPETGSNTSEGVALTNANAWHTAGFTGTGVSVAVIDVGFHWTCTAEGTNDIPTPNTKVFYGVPQFYNGGVCTPSGPLTTGMYHGTNVTDILIDMAPDVDLHLIRIGDESDLMDAKDYCVTNGIDIVNMSLGWYEAGDYAGNGVLCSIVDDAHANGILWVKSAGNAQENHYLGMYSDTDADGLHNFAAGDNSNYLFTSSGSTDWMNAGWEVNIYVSWDWPTSAVDYDLFLYREGVASPVASSTNALGIGEEHINYTYPVAGQYYFQIERVGGTGNKQLNIHTPYYQPEYQTAASSFTLPADAAGCMAVGARDWSGWVASSTVEDYSSFGPTLDGRLKPDIVAPTRVDVSISSDPFGGTSGAAPHVAGAAALVMQACPSMSADEVRDFLTGRATDAGAAGPDNEWGWGKLNLGSPTDPCPGAESITVTAPNGGECWEFGTVHNIMWTSSGTSGLVDISYSADGGATWSLIFNDVVDDGSEPWTIPGTSSAICLVMIVDADGSPSDESDGTFSIMEDCGGCTPLLANLALDTYQQITWAPPLWTVQVQIRNFGPGGAYNVTATMNSDIAWLVIPDPNCTYADIPSGGDDWGIDNYTFDLTSCPGGTFSVWFNVEYDDNCGNHHILRLDPEFNEPTDATPALSYNLGQNYPNPFNPSTSISFQIPTPGHVSLNIYNASGKLVRTLVNGHRSEGSHEVNWNGKDNKGAAVVSGIYFYKLNAGSFTKTKKMALLR